MDNFFVRAIKAVPVNKTDSDKLKKRPTKSKSIAKKSKKSSRKNYKVEQL